MDGRVTLRCKRSGFKTNSTDIKEANEESLASFFKIFRLNFPLFTNYELLFQKRVLKVTIFE
jgi:hypothetical protein